MIIRGTTITNSAITIDITYLADPIVPVWYDLSQFNAGGMNIVDSSGNRNNGTIHSALNHEGLLIDTATGGGMKFSGTQWIASPYILSQDFTVSMAIKYNPDLNNFPACFWGSDYWDNNAGYIAALTDTDIISFGIAGDLNGFPGLPTSTVQTQLTSPRAVTVLDFVKLGTVFTIYVNGQIGGQQDFGQEGTASTLPIVFASRHQNDSTFGIADSLVGSIYDIKVRNYGVTAPECNLIFQGIRSRYGL
jgi:hypothetical protein